MEALAPWRLGSGGGGSEEVLAPSRFGVGGIVNRSWLGVGGFNAVVLTPLGLVRREGVVRRCGEDSEEVLAL